MFIVSGFKRSEEMARWLDKNPRRRNESEAGYTERIKKEFRPRQRCLNEYDCLDVAEKYMQMLIDDGYEDCQIKIVKFVRGTGNRLVQRTLVDVSELGDIDAAEQAKLKAMA